MALRQEVFVIEQNCPYLDADGKDQKSEHLLVYAENGDLAAYLRVVYAGVSYDELSIGRVVTAQKYRRIGLGKLLMKKGLQEVKNRFGNVPIHISAQCYLNNFYEAFGFEAIGETYLEDGIPHIGMILKKMI
jgi:ElaA protein